MKKIRINELARDLEIKANLILDKLPDFGVTEKKTHSSSVDEDVAEKLRDFFVGSGSPRNREEDIAHPNGTVAHAHRSEELDDVDSTPQAPRQQETPEAATILAAPEGDSVAPAASS